MNAAIGMIEVEGIAGIIRAGDAAAKTSQVDLLGWESIGGYTTLFISGSISDVEAAIKAGHLAAHEAIEHVVCSQLTRPDDAFTQFIATKPQATDIQPGALGVIEARGYGHHVPRNDAMVKAANVVVWNVITVMSRIVCSLVIGNVGDVREAVRTAQSAIPDEHLMSATVISRPHINTLQTFSPTGVA